MRHTFIKTPSGEFVKASTVTLVEVEELSPEHDYAVIVHAADKTFCYASEDTKEDAEATAQFFLESLGFRIVHCME